MQFYCRVFIAYLRYNNMRQVNVENTNVLSIEREVNLFSVDSRILQSASIFQSAIYNISNFCRPHEIFVDLESQLRQYIFSDELNYFSSRDTYIINLICGIITLAHDYVSRVKRARVCRTGYVV